MKIDRKTLSLVIDVENAEGVTLKVHSAPISKAVFEVYFLEITKTFSAMMEQGEVWMRASGPKAAGLMLKRTAVAMNTWEGPIGVENGLLNELRRLTNVFVPTEEGWKMIPLSSAVSREIINEEDAEEVESTIVFFTVCWASMQRAEREMFYGLFGERATSSSASEFMSSLPTLTPEESTGETEKASFMLR